MVAQTYDKYLIETAQRIDIRYYLIKVHEKYYVIDYSNPRNIKNYFPGLFKETISQWKIYDVTNIKEDIKIKKSFFHRIQYNVQTKIAWVSIIFILILLNGMLFPKFINFMDLTYTPQIFQHWKLVLFLIIMGYFIGVLFLICTKQSKLPLNEAESFILKQVKKEKTDRKWYLGWLDRLPNSLRWTISVFFVVPFFVALGIGRPQSSNYVQLLFLGIIPLYSLLFSSFISFNPIENREKYQIIKSEEK